MLMDDEDGFDVCGSLLLMALVIADMLFDSGTLAKLGRSTEMLNPVSEELFCVPFVRLSFFLRPQSCTDHLDRTRKPMSCYAISRSDVSNLRVADSVDKCHPGLL